jgi:hypothetical protein
MLASRRWVMDIRQIELGASIFLADGKFGLLIRVDLDKGILGAQVFGEEEIRWICADRITTKGGAYFEW